MFYQTLQKILEKVSSLLLKASNTFIRTQYVEHESSFTLPQEEYLLTLYEGST